MKMSEKEKIALAKKLKVRFGSITNWENKGLDIFTKAKELNAIRGNKKIQILWQNLKIRCNKPKNLVYLDYGAKGILLKLTKENIAYLWKRDKASKMKQPSIDRINTYGDYELQNCRFIEMVKNRSRMKHSKIHGIQRTWVSFPAKQWEIIKKMSLEKSLRTSTFIQNIVLSNLATETVATKQEVKHDVPMGDRQSL